MKNTFPRRRPAWLLRASVRPGCPARHKICHGSEVFSPEKCPSLQQQRRHCSAGGGGTVDTAAAAAAAFPVSCCPWPPHGTTAARRRARQTTHQLPASCRDRDLLQKSGILDHYVTVHHCETFHTSLGLNLCVRPGGVHLLFSMCYIT